MAGISHPNSTDFLGSYQLWLHLCVIKDNKSLLWAKFSPSHVTVMGLAPLKLMGESLSSRGNGEQNVAAVFVKVEKKHLHTHMHTRTYLLHVGLIEHFPLQKRGNKLLFLQKMIFHTNQDFPHKEKTFPKNVPVRKLMVLVLFYIYLSQHTACWKTSDSPK